MSTTVDERVVGLGFDNKQFESGTRQSLETIDALKKGLNFDDSVSSLSSLSNATRSFDLSGVGGALSSISDRFSMLGIIGMSVISNLTGAVMRFGQKLVSDMLGPMRDGMKEYELQMDSVQTILANTSKDGTKLSDVTAALDELNSYADQTIYNFGQMTSNIGRFTSAGVKLDVSVSAIKGIANLAAVSGSNAQQASSAMYQLSQAISSGTIRLMDWNSVVNAGMGGKVFQDALIETARVNGVAIDDIIKKQGSFRDSLETGWLSSEIMIQTLAKFTGDLSEAQLLEIGYTKEQAVEILKMGETAKDAATKVKTLTQLKDTLKEAVQSGWAKSFQLIIGDFEQAKELFTKINDILGGYIGRSADARNETIRMWATFGGRENLINTLFNAFDSFSFVAKLAGEAFREFFPEQPVWDDILKVTKALENFSRALYGQVMIHADELKRIFSGVFAVMRMGWDVVTNLTSAFVDLFKKNVKVDGGGILESLAKIGDFFVNLQKTLDIKAAFSKGLEYLNERILSIKTELGKLVGGIKERVDKLKEIFAGFIGKIDLSPLKNWFKELFKGANIGEFKPVEAILRGFREMLFGVLDGAIKLGPKFRDFLKNTIETFKELPNGIINFFKNVDFTEIFNFVNSGLMAAILLGIRKFLSSGSEGLAGITGIFDGVKQILDGVRGALEAWQQNLQSKTLLNIALAVGLIAASLVVLSTIETDKLLGVMGAITGIFLELVTAQAAFSKIGGMSAKVGLNLIAMAISMLILSKAMVALSSIDQKALTRGTLALYGLLGGMAGFSYLMSKVQADLLKGGVGMIAVATSMLVLVEVVKKLANISPEQLAQGLIGVGVMLGEIAAFIRLIDNKGVSKGLGLLALAGAIIVLGIAVEKLGKLDVKVLQQGLIAIGAVLGGLAAFTRFSGNGANLIATALGVVILTGALILLTGVIKKLGNMSLEELGKGLGAMGVALVIIAGAMRLMPVGLVVQAVGLIIVAGALVILSEAVAKMAGMSWEEVARGLIAMAGALGIIALGLYLMTGTIPGSLALLVASAALTVLAGVMERLGAMPIQEIGLALLAIAGIFVIMGLAGLVLAPLVPILLGLGAAMLLFGAGAALVGLGLLLFSTGMMALGAGGAVAAAGIAAFITTMLAMLPTIVTILMDTLVALARGIVEAAPALFEALTVLISGILQLLIDVSPKLFKLLGILLQGLIDLINKYAPQIIDCLINLLVTLLQTIAERLPEFLQAGIDIIINLLKGIRDNIAEVVETAVEVITAFLDALGEQMPKIVDAGFDLILDFINGMNNGIEAHKWLLLNSIGALAQSIIDGLAEGISSGATKVVDAIVAMAKDAIAAAWTQFDSNSPSEEFIDLAETIPDGLVVGLKKYGYRAIEGMQDFGEKVLDSASIINSAFIGDEFSPTITPVIDMDALTKSISDTKNLLSGIPLNLEPTVGKAAAVNKALAEAEIKASPSSKEDQNGSKSGITFNQYNTSPEALNRLEIYRQTKNQLLQIQGLGVSS